MAFLKNHAIPEMQKPNTASHLAGSHTRKTSRRDRTLQVFSFVFIFLVWKATEEKQDKIKIVLSPTNQVTPKKAISVVAVGGVTPVY